jgi:hypothetical protein
VCTLPGRVKRIADSASWDQLATQYGHYLPYATCNISLKASLHSTIMARCDTMCLVTPLIGHAHPCPCLSMNFHMCNSEEQEKSTIQRRNPKGLNYTHMLRMTHMAHLTHMPYILAIRVLHKACQDIPGMHSPCISTFVSRCEHSGNCPSNVQQHYRPRLSCETRRRRTSDV